jgi:cathepsin B
METGFEVYHDFFNYKSGVYHHVTGELAGGHAVKILGWGTDEEGTDFWICCNSWGPDWGESGFFRIKMKEGGIDQSVWSCLPEVEAQKPVVSPVFQEFVQ